MTKRVHVQVFYSPSCPFSFREIAKIRETMEAFKDQVRYEEIDMYENQKEAEEMDSTDFYPDFSYRSS